MDFSFYTKRFVLNLTFSLMVWLSTEQMLVRGDTVIDVNSNCPNLAQSLGDDCSVNDDCTKITCSKRFAKRDLTLTLDIDKCGDPVTVTARMQVPDLGIDWSHKYSSDDIVAVPGFTVDLPGMSAGVYVQVQLNSVTNQLNLKVKLLAGVKFFGHSSYPLKTTVIESDLPIDTSECGIVRWWRELGTALQAVVIGAPLLVLILLITCCCCCCCRNSHRPVSTAGPAVVVIPGTQPDPAIMTTTNSRVPMKPLENTA